MKLLIRAARIIDPESPYHNKVMDLLIENGIISRIASEIREEGIDREIKYPNLHISQGWFDSSVSFGEPGFEDRETIENGLRTAGYSGFTSVALNPGNEPVTDNKGTVSFLRSKNNDLAASLYPIGALTRNSLGKEMAELYDMQQAGAVAFGDYKKAVADPGMLKLALQYARGFDGLVLSFPQEERIAGKGQVNEHHSSTSLGLRGIPALAEELQLVRDLKILEYTGGKLHIPTISTAGAVELIRQAKDQGLDVTCAVAIHNLFYTDDVLQEFNSNAKVLPPLRTRADIKALLSGIKDGTIDMVTSDHNPINIENKKVEFEHALYGTLGLESAFGALIRLVSLKTAVRLLTAGKHRFNIPENVIHEGSPADLTFFDPDPRFVFTQKQIFSTSKNSIFMDQELQGRVYGVLAKNIFSASPNAGQ